MNKGFEKRRKKVADAEVRKLANKRKDELQKVRDHLQVQMDKLNDFETQLLEREREQSTSSNPSDQFSPEKQTHLARTLDSLKTQFQEFKDQFERVDDQIRDINADIANRDLENDEPLPQLA